MKLTRGRLKRIIEEELEQEGFLDTVKSKLAPGMLAKNLTDEYRIVVDAAGQLDLDPSQIYEKGNIIATLNKAKQEVQMLFQDEKFQKLPNSYKQKMGIYFDVLAKSMSKIKDSLEASGPSGVMSFMKKAGVPTDSGLMKLASGVVSAQKGRDAAAEKERQDKEERERRDRNDYEGKKNANVDAAIASEKEKEKAAAQARRAARDAEESRAAAPYNGRASSFSSRETGNVRDAWEESKKSNKNIVKEGNNMKLTRDRLKKIIKEELEEMMGGMSAGAEQAYDKPATDQVKGRAKVHYGHISSAMENPKVPNLKNDQEYMKLRAYVNKQGVPDELEYKIFTDGSGQIGDEKFSKNLVNSLMLAGIYAGNQNF